jgi:adenine-specific DNA-methyltransferase
MATDPRLIEFARQMRRGPTPAEERLWRLLRDRRLAGYKFRRQHPIGPYIADFYAASAALVIELDGDTHCTEEGIELDRIRHAYLESLSIAVIRFWNFEVKEDTDALLETIGAICEERRGRKRRTPPQDARRRRTR